MHTVSVIGQKGGTGKTTIALGLAVEAARRGVPVAVVDLDPQASAASWRDRRQAADVVVVSCVPARLAPTLAALREGGIALLLIDTAGRLHADGIDAARVSDLVLVPTRIGILDAEPLRAVRDLLRIAGDPPAWLVVNAVHPSATQRAAEAKAVLAGAAALPASAAHLCQRSAYVECLTHGLGPQESEPGGRAGAELAALYDDAWTHMSMHPRGHA